MYRLVSPILIFMVSAITLFSGCMTEQIPDEERIQGLWKLHQATRNDKITNSLDGMFIDFTSASSFDSNILGDTSSFVVKLSNRNLQIDHELIQKFEIIDLSDTLLKMNTEINGDQISLIFNR